MAVRGTAVLAPVVGVQAYVERGCLPLQGKLVNETRCLQCETGACCPCKQGGMMCWQELLARCSACGDVVAVHGNAGNHPILD